MKTLGNFIWHIPFLGFVNAIIVYLLGLVLSATVIASPIGLGLLEYGIFLLWPSGNAMINKKSLGIEQNSAWEKYSKFIMVLYFPIGLALFLIALVQVLALFTSIIGIPVAMVLFKSLGVYLNPIDKKCVHQDVADALANRKAKDAVTAALN